MKLTLTITGSVEQRNIRAEAGIDGNNVTADDLIAFIHAGVKTLVKIGIGTALRMNDPAAAITIFAQLFDVDPDPEDVKGSVRTKPT